MGWKRKPTVKMYAETEKSGPGGFNCECCNPYNVAPRFAKPVSRRHFRRARKLSLQKELEELMIEGLVLSETPNPWYVISYKEDTDYAGDFYIMRESDVEKIYDEDEPFYINGPFDSHKEAEHWVTSQGTNLEVD